MDNDRIATDVEVIPLDLKKVPGLVPEGRKPRHTYGVIRTRVGMFVVCTEGVGHHSSYDQLPIDDEDNLFAIKWVMMSKKRLFGEDGPRITAEQLTEMMQIDGVCKSPVNLQRWVRTFGTRLDCNYNEWRRAMEAIESGKDPVKPKTPDPDAPLGPETRQIALFEGLLRVGSMDLIGVELHVENIEYRGKLWDCGVVDLQHQMIELGMYETDEEMTAAFDIRGCFEPA